MSQLGVRGLGVRTLSAVLGAGALIGFGGGCFITNTSHCGFHQDGANNPCPGDMVCNVCAAENNGCVPKAEADAIEVQCRDTGGTTTSTQTGTPDPTVGPSTTPTEPTTLTTTETTTTSTTIGPTTDPVETATETSTTEAPATTIMTPCNPTGDPECGEQYCVAENQCGWCTSLPADKTCVDVDEDTPVCDAVSGKCVQCTKEEPQACSGATPVCDEESHTCVPCTEHSQCATACDIQEGVCFPDDPEFIFYVQRSENDCLTKDGKSEQSPFCKLSDVPLMAPKVTIRLMSSAVSLPHSLAVDEGKAVALVRRGAQPPEINNQSGAGPTLEISTNARLYISEIKLRFAPVGAYVVKCAGGSFYAHDAVWEGNGMQSSRALDASMCKTFIHRTRILRNGAGLQVSNGELLVENSFIMENGVSSYGAFNFLNAVTAKITYSTIARNKPINGVSTFNCMGPGQQITVRNSAVIGVAGLTNCAENQLTFENGKREEVGDAQAADTLMAQWFNAPISDVYTPKDGPLKDTAMWETGDPKLDFTKTPIPTDAPSFAGAKQPI